MDNMLRVLWLDNQECVLFNSFEKKTSRRCPAFVGRIAEKVGSGEKIENAIDAENIENAYRKRTYDIINQISGKFNLNKFSIGQHDRKFNKTLVLCPCSNCNLRCVYCSGTAGEKKNELMDWILAKKSIDYFIEHCADNGPYTLQFHGAGEPLLNFEVVKKSVLYAKERFAGKGQKLFTRISTNGVVPSKIAKWVAQNIDHVSLSLDGFPEIHNFQRPKINGSSSYENVLQTIKELETTQVLKRVNTVVTAHNIDKLEEILKHIRSVSQVKELRLLPVSNCGRCEKSGIIEVDSSIFEKELNKIIPIAKSLNIKLLSLIEQVDYFTEYYCGACGFNMCVAQNGNISTCVEVLDKNDPGSDELIIGKFNLELKKIEIDWNKVAYLRTRTYKNIKGCATCTFRTNCSGSCLVRAARKNGTVMSFDKSQCRMVKDVLTKHFCKMSEKMTNENGQNHKLFFHEAIRICIDVIKKFDKINQRKWTVEVAMIELMKQVGDLSKYLMSYEGYYLINRKNHPNYKTSKDAIANELADLILGIVRIAAHYNIDLEEAFRKARNDEIGYIKSSITQERKI
ncbi:hypothetical protein KKHLCK_17215 [Candidatus Electrothrix laxa]